MSICPLCDERYDPTDAERSKVHEHPEPQSGGPREQWFRSGLPYEEWVKDTPEGIAWEQYKSNMNRKATQ